MNGLLSFPTRANAQRHLRTVPLSPLGFPPAGAWTPANLGFEVIADAATGVYLNAGSAAAAANGATVQSWLNAGLLGGVLVKPGDQNGARYRPNSGKPYLEFGRTGGIGYRLAAFTGQANLGDLTVHMVLYHDHTTGVTHAGQVENVMWATSAATNGSGDNGFENAIVVDRSYNFNLGSDDGHAVSTAQIMPVTDGLWHVCSWRRKGRAWTAWVDGQQVLTLPAGTKDPTAGAFTVGGSSFGAGYSGGVAAALYSSRAHSDAEVLQVQQYYLANHPLLARPAKALVWCGDSTSCPQNAYATDATSSTWLMTRGLVWQTGSYLQTNNALGNFYNNSYGGKNTSDHRRLVELTRIAGWLNRSTGAKALVIYSGTNDIRAGGAGLTPAQSYAQLLGLMTDVQALAPGVVTFIATICDGDPAFYAGFTALRNTLNGLISGGDVANGYTAVRIDLDAVGLDGAYSTHPEWFVTGDGLHRIAPGMDREAAVFQAAVTALL